MQMKSLNGKLVASALAVASITAATGVAHAYVQRRIVNQHTTVYLSDRTWSGQLSARLTLAAHYSKLHVIENTVGRYNARLSTRCSDGRLIDRRPRNLTSPNFNIYHECGPTKFPLRIEGALDDIKD